jgi:hypothetical protein
MSGELIEDGVPVPQKESKYAVLGKLRVGQSAVIAVPRSSSLSKTIAVLQTKTGKRFKRLKVEGGVRVWRIDPEEAKPRKGKKSATPIPVAPPSIDPVASTPMPAPPTEDGEASLHAVDAEA